MAIKQYVIIGRALPTEAVPQPKIYRMKVFAKNSVVAKSKFWVFISKLKKVKKTKGQVLGCHLVSESSETKASTYGVWLRYDSRSGTHNMYKEYRDVTKVGAVEQMYNDMAGRHRARHTVVSVIKVVELKSSEVRRPHAQRFLSSKISFPQKENKPVVTKNNFTTFQANRPNMH